MVWADSVSVCHTRLEVRRTHGLGYEKASAVQSNNLTGRSRQFPRQCPVSTNAIASQLVKTGKCEGANREISRFLMQELSEFWRATAPDAVNIPGDFSPREFAAALHPHLLLPSR